MIKSLRCKNISSEKKKIYTACIALLFLFFLLDVRLWADTQKLELSFLEEDKWQFEGTGFYEGWADRRNLFVLYHPWYPTETGKFGTVTRQIKLPTDFESRVRLHFYMTDDYDGYAKTSGWETRTSFVGHRFKQVLINDKVVWEKDVADKEGKSQPSRFSIVLPDTVKGGDKINLSFRLIDKIATSQHLDGDFFEKGIAKRPDKTYRLKFMTHLYIGDIVLTPETIETVEPGESPIKQVVRNIHKKQKLLKPYGENIKFPVALSLENWENLFSLTCPIRCGIPLPAGKVRNTNQIILRDMKAQAIPIQTKAMNYWPDGSIRWLELDGIAESRVHTRKLMLDINNGESQPLLPEQPVSVTCRQNQATIKTGQIEIITGGNNQFINKLTNGSAVFENLIGEIKIDGKTYRTIIDKTKVLAKGPIRAEVELSGDLKGKNDCIGRFVFRLCSFAGQPFIRMTWRIFNETQKKLNISRFELIGSYKADSSNTIYWGHHKRNTKDGITVQQLIEDQYQVFDKHKKNIYTGEHAPGWLAITGDKKSLMVQVRHFYQQFPKALEFKNDKLRISLFESSKSGPDYTITEGEAKRHEIWLALWDKQVRDEQLEKNAKCFARPPRLYDADYFCKSGGFGYAAPYDENRFPGYFAEMKHRYPNISAEEVYEFGIRNWGDKSSGSKRPTAKLKWLNGYYDQQRSLANAYLMTGEKRWFDRLEAVVRHIIDVDICHFSKTHPQYVGGIYDCHRGAGDHTSGEPWEPTQRNKGTLDYWRLSGDIDARDAALGVADFAIRENRGIGAVSVRNHAGIFYCLTAAYDETLDAKYLKVSRRLLDDILKNRIDPRRGCYAEVHGNVSYRGNIPWMVVQLAESMYYYYRQSGDIDAAIAIVGMAESLITENASRTNPGLLHGYSHNPHFCGPDDDYSASYHCLIAPTILYAYELTGDEEFLIRGQAMYKQTIKDRKVRSIKDAGWNTPTLFYYLNKYKNK